MRTQLLVEYGLENYLLPIQCTFSLLETFMGGVQRTGAGPKLRIFRVVFKSDRDHGSGYYGTQNPWANARRSTRSLGLYPIHLQAMYRYLFTDLHFDVRFDFSLICIECTISLIHRFLLLPRYRYHTAIEPLAKGLRIANKHELLTVYAWPESNTCIEDSKKDKMIVSPLKSICKSIKVYVSPLKFMFRVPKALP